MSDKDFHTVPLGIDDAKKLTSGDEIVTTSVKGETVVIDTTLDPDVE
jgi:hypothetical protein